MKIKIVAGGVVSLINTLSGVGIAILALGTVIAQTYQVGAGLGIFAVGVVLTSFGAAKSKKDVKKAIQA